MQREISRSYAGTMGLQTTGLYLSIFAMAQAGIVPSTIELANKWRVTPTQILRLAEKLLDMKIIEKRQITASHGRGRLHAFYPILDLATILELLQRSENEISLD